MKTKWQAIATPDGPMEGYLAEPDGGGPYAAVLVLQEAFGVNGYVRSVCERLADRGFVALAPELFHRSGRHVELAYDDMPRVVQELGALTMDGVEDDVGTAIAALRARSDVDPKRIGVVGFCFGGYAAILAGLTTAVEAVVAFYPGMLVQPRPNLKLRPLIDRVHQLRAATLIQLGGDDPGFPQADIEAIRRELGRSKARHEVHVWPGAKHGFHSDDRAPVFHPRAAEEAWHETLHWLAEALRSPA